MTVSKGDLLKARFGIEDVEIPGVGTVKVRALTRGEALQVQGQEMGIAEMEQKLIALAMVEPKLTEAEVKEWQDNSTAGEIQVVTEVIVRLSGMEQSAPKEAMKRFPG